jgi:hypothetical protein
MRMRRSLLLSLAVAATLAGAAPASAQECIAPPGTAAVEQYCELVPEADGNRGSIDRRPGRAVSPATVRRIAASGDSGAALARTLRTGHSDAPAKARPSTPPSDNPLGAVTSAIGSGSGTSAGFIVALLAVTLLVGGAAWARHRRSP